MSLMQTEKVRVVVAGSKLCDSQISCEIMARMRADDSAILV